ncbi:hypothetical protein PCE1_001037 [Barthelona sp. PCE]
MSYDIARVFDDRKYVIDTLGVFCVALLHEGKLHRINDIFSHVSPTDMTEFFEYFSALLVNRANEPLFTKLINDDILRCMDADLMQFTTAANAKFGNICVPMSMFYREQLTDSELHEFIESTNKQWYLEINDVSHPLIQSILLALGYSLSFEDAQSCINLKSYFEDVFYEDIMVTGDFSIETAFKFGVLNNILDRSAFLEKLKAVSALNPSFLFIMVVLFLIDEDITVEYFTRDVLPLQSIIISPDPFSRFLDVFFEQNTVQDCPPWMIDCIDCVTIGLAMAYWEGQHFDDLIKLINVPILEKMPHLTFLFEELMFIVEYELCYQAPIFFSQDFKFGIQESLIYALTQLEKPVYLYELPSFFDGLEHTALLLLQPNSKTFLQFLDHFDGLESGTVHWNFSAFVILTFFFSIVSLIQGKPEVITPFFMFHPGSVRCMVPELATEAIDILYRMLNTCSNIVRSEMYRVTEHYDIDIKEVEKMISLLLSRYQTLNGSITLFLNGFSLATVFFGEKQFGESVYKMLSGSVMQTAISEGSLTLDPQCIIETDSFRENSTALAPLLGICIVFSSDNTASLKDLKHFLSSQDLSDIEHLKNIVQVPGSPQSVLESAHSIGISSDCIDILMQLNKKAPSISLLRWLVEPLRIFSELLMEREYVLFKELSEVIEADCMVIASNAVEKHYIVKEDIDSLFFIKFWSVNPFVAVSLMFTDDLSNLKFGNLFENITLLEKHRAYLNHAEVKFFFSHVSRENPILRRLFIQTGLVKRFGDVISADHSELHLIESRDDLISEFRSSIDDVEIDVWSDSDSDIDDSSQDVSALLSPISSIKRERVLKTKPTGMTRRSLSFEGNPPTFEDSFRMFERNPVSYVLNDEKSFSQKLKYAEKFLHYQYEEQYLKLRETSTADDFAHVLEIYTDIFSIDIVLLLGLIKLAIDMTSEEQRFQTLYHIVPLIEYEHYVFVLENIQCFMPLYYVLKLWKDFSQICQNTQLFNVYLEKSEIAVKSLRVYYQIFLGTVLNTEFIDGEPDLCFEYLTGLRRSNIRDKYSDAHLCHCLYSMDWVKLLEVDVLSLSNHLFNIDLGDLGLELLLCRKDLFHHFSVLKAESLTKSLVYTRSIDLSVDEFMADNHTVMFELMISLKLPNLLHGVFLKRFLSRLTNPKAVLAVGRWVIDVYEDYGFLEGESFNYETCPNSCTPLLIKKLRDTLTGALIVANLGPEEVMLYKESLSRPTNIIEHLLMCNNVALALRLINMCRKAPRKYISDSFVESFVVRLVLEYAMKALYIHGKNTDDIELEIPIRAVKNATTVTPKTSKNNDVFVTLPVHQLSDDETDAVTANTITTIWSAQTGSPNELVVNESAFTPFYTDVVRVDLDDTLSEIHESGNVSSLAFSILQKSNSLQTQQMGFSPLLTGNKDLDTQIRQNFAYPYPPRVGHVFALVSLVTDELELVLVLKVLVVGMLSFSFKVPAFDGALHLDRLNVISKLFFDKFQKLTEEQQELVENTEMFKDYPCKLLTKCDNTVPFVHHLCKLHNFNLKNNVLPMANPDHLERLVYDLLEADLLSQVLLYSQILPPKLQLKVLTKATQRISTYMGSLSDILHWIDQLGKLKDFGLAQNIDSILLPLMRLPASSISFITLPTISATLNCFYKAGFNQDDKQSLAPFKNLDNLAIPVFLLNGLHANALNFGHKLQFLNVDEKNTITIDALLEFEKELEKRERNIMAKTLLLSAPVTWSNVKYYVTTGDIDHAIMNCLSNPQLFLRDRTDEAVDKGTAPSYVTNASHITGNVEFSLITERISVFMANGGLYLMPDVCQHLLSGLIFPVIGQGSGALDTFFSELKRLNKNLLDVSEDIQKIQTTMLNVLAFLGCFHYLYHYYALEGNHYYASQCCMAHIMVLYEKKRPVPTSLIDRLNWHIVHGAQRAESSYASGAKLDRWNMDDDGTFEEHQQLVQIQLSIFDFFNRYSTPKAYRLSKKPAFVFVSRRMIGDKDLCVEEIESWSAMWHISLEHDDDLITILLAMQCVSAIVFDYISIGFKLLLERMMDCNHFKGISEIFEKVNRPLSTPFFLDLVVFALQNSVTVTKNIVSYRLEWLEYMPLQDALDMCHELSLLEEGHRLATNHDRVFEQSQFRNLLNSMISNKRKKGGIN